MWDKTLEDGTVVSVGGTWIGRDQDWSTEHWTQGGMIGHFPLGRADGADVMERLA